MFAGFLVIIDPDTYESIEIPTAQGAYFDDGFIPNWIKVVIYMDGPVDWDPTSIESKQQNEYCSISFSVPATTT
jgi:hypothetical protein